MWWYSEFEKRRLHHIEREMKQLNMIEKGRGICDHEIIDFFFFRKRKNFYQSQSIKKLPFFEKLSHLDRVMEDYEKDMDGMEEYINSGGGICDYLKENQLS